MKSPESYFFIWDSDSVSDSDSDSVSDSDSDSVSDSDSDSVSDSVSDSDSESYFFIDYRKINLKVGFLPSLDQNRPV